MPHDFLLEILNATQSNDTILSELEVLELKETYVNCLSHRRPSYNDPNPGPEREKISRRFKIHRIPSYMDAEKECGGIDINAMLSRYRIEPHTPILLNDSM